ncbi:MAG: MOSC domain-containing protein [Pseudomonadota bacterium]
MTGGRVTSIWRHPIKSHGREALDAISLIKGQTMPGDRVWGVAHDRSDVDGSAWASCRNFSRCSEAPSLQAIHAETHDDGRLTLRHPDLSPLTFDPETEPQAIIDWAGTLIPPGKRPSARLVRAQAAGFTDSDFPSVTLCNSSSHRAVEQRAGQDLSIHRWRGNIWLEGLGPWEEFEWMDGEVQIGDAVFRVRERTDRCPTTMANPETGERDVDTLAALRHWGHMDFSVRAEVIQSGTLRVGDGVSLL